MTVVAIPILHEVIFAVTPAAVSTSSGDHVRYARCLTIRGGPLRIEWATSPSGPWDRNIVGADSQAVIGTVERSFAALPRIATKDAYP